VADVPRLPRGLDRRDLLVERDGVHLPALRIELDPPWRAVEIAGLPVPLLSLTPVRRQLHHPAVRAPERFVTVEEHLNPVPPGWSVGEAGPGVPEGARIHRPQPSRGPGIHVDSEDQLGLPDVGDLEPRLGGAVVRQQEQQPAVERGDTPLGGKADLEPGSGRGEARLSRERERKQEEQRKRRASGHGRTWREGQTSGGFAEPSYAWPARAATAPDIRNDRGPDKALAERPRGKENQWTVCRHGRTQATNSDHITHRMRHG
jgi:hypothetical protein